MEALPPELMGEIEAALRAWDVLEEEGCRVRFRRDPATGRLSGELVDVREEPWLALSPRAVIELAAGISGGRGSRAPSP